jgi:hypothetical protein
LAILILSLSILVVIFDSDQTVNTILGLTIITSMIIGWIYLTFRFSSQMNPQQTRHAMPTENRDRRRLFYTRIDRHCSCKVYQSGLKDRGYKACKAEVFSTYAALYVGSMWYRDTITFNKHNLKWIGQIQHIDKTISEVCFDLDVDGIWYTIWVQMVTSETKDFVAALAQMLPESLRRKRNRERPNIRYRPIQASLLDIENPNSQKANDPLELYLTPLYLVIVMNTFVGQAIPVDSIASFEVGVAPEMLPDRRILRLKTTNGTLNYTIPNCPEFEDRLAQITR